MAEKSEYLDFDLLIERSGEENYRARVLSSPAGTPAKDITIPPALSGIELENFLLKIGRPRRKVRRIESSEMEAVKEFGAKLYQTVFDDDLLRALENSLEKARKENKGLRLRLRLNDAPELVNLPWEYLYNPSLNRFLSLSVSTPLVRYLELPESVNPLNVQLPLRVLVMISSPTDYPTLDVEKEWDNLKAALCGLEERGLMVVERLDEASPVALQYALRQKNYHIFHFIGHGAFNAQTQDGILLFEDSNQRGQELSGQFLSTILHDAPTLRLIVLNACEGARSGATDPFAGVAQSLVQQGLPAVVAMQIEITDDAAITFAREFYTAIAEDFPVDAAMSEARKIIYSQVNEFEWATPVLYMRAPDGRIFDVDRSSLTEAAQEAAKKRVRSGEEVKPASRSGAAKDSDIDLDALYINGLSAYWLKNWAQAWEYFHKVEQIDSNYKDLPTRLAEVKKQLNIATLTDDADRQAEEGNWSAVVEALQKLVQEMPNDSTLIERLENAKKEAQLLGLYTQAKQLHQAEQWKAVLNVFEQLHAIQPDYADPDDLLGSAQKEADEIDRQWQLKTLYAQALNALDGEQWQEAANLFSQVRELDSDYRDTAQHLERINEQFDLDEVALSEQNALEALDTQAGLTSEAEAQPAAALETAPAAIPAVQPELEPPGAVKRFAMPKWAYFAAGGVVLAIILGVIFLGGGSGGGEVGELEAEPAEAAAVAPGDTPTPAEAETAVEEASPSNTPTRPAPTGTPTEAPVPTDIPEPEEPSQDVQSGPFVAEYYFFDDFSSKEIPWKEITAGATTILIEDGSYIIHMNEPDDNIISEIPLLESASIISFTATNLAGSEYGSYGVYCNYPDTSTYYEIRLDASYPEYSFWEIINDEWNPMLPGEFVETNALNLGDGAVNQVDILCQPGYIELVINGELVERQDLETVSTPGRMEFILDTWGDEIGPDGFQVAFDDVSVSSEFFENFTTNVHGWEDSIYEIGYQRVEDGGYTIQVDQPGRGLFAVAPLDYAPTQIWFSTTSDSTDGSYGLSCNAIDGDNYISFRFETSAPEYSVLQHIGGETNQLFDFVSTDNLNYGVDAINLFYIQCKPDELTLYINGVEEFGVSLDEAFPGPGEAAFVVQTWDTFENTHTVIFDDFGAQK